MNSVQPPADRNDFRVAMVCALPREADAVTLLFDQFWDQERDIYGQAAQDTNTYITGRIGEHNIVLAVLSGVGKTSATAAVASLRSSYTGLKLVILVGICGGVPRIAHSDALLGDVVVSKTIIQYDYGRQYPGHLAVKNAVEDSLGRANKDIRTLLTAFETELVRERLEVEASKNLMYLQEAAKKERRQANYQYPGSKEDKLFPPTYIHKHREGCSVCSDDADIFCEAASKVSCAEARCNVTNVVVRERSAELLQGGAFSPKIFIGQIGSGNTVMKSGEDRDRIAAAYNLIAFDMEDTGPWDKLPYIVVKGICNYADSHKNETWQDFAAATAASMAKAILGRYARHKLDWSELVVDSESASWLESKGLLGPIVDKRRSMSTAVFLEGTSTHTEVSLAREKGTYIPSLEDRYRLVNIPVHLFSTETYEFLGYTRDVAETLWQRFQFLLDSPYGFLDVAKQHIRDAKLKSNFDEEAVFQPQPPTANKSSSPSRQKEDVAEDWRSQMIKIGISDDLREAILIPEFRNICCTESCEFWLLTAIDIRWAELRTLNECVRKLHMSSGDNAKDFSGDDSTTMSQSPLHRTGRGASATGSKLPSSSEAGERSIPLVSSKYPNLNLKDEDKIDLWRGGVEAEWECSTNTDTRRLNLTSMCRPIGDFSGRLSVPYFTPDRETALQYAAFHRVLSGWGVHTCLLQVTVSRQWLMGLQHHCFWNIQRPCYWDPSHGCPHIPGLSWKELVFHCRVGRTKPDELEDKQLLIGDIARCHTEDFSKITSPAGISDDDVLNVKGHNAIQFAFVSERAQNELERHATFVVKTKVTLRTWTIDDGISLAKLPIHQVDYEEYIPSRI